MAKCTKCGTELTPNGDRYVCESCGKQYKRKTQQIEDNQNQQEPKIEVEAEVLQPPVETTQTEVVQPNEISTKSSVEEKTSKFDGGLLGLIGIKLLGFIVTLCTLGIAYPWVVCKTYKWEIEHKIIDGNRLGFDGTAMGLFGSWIKWLLLSLVTFGIYSLWLPIKLEKWKTKHTYFAGDETTQQTQLTEEEKELIKQEKRKKSLKALKTTALIFTIVSFVIAVIINLVIGFGKDYTSIVYHDDRYEYIDDGDHKGYYVYESGYDWESYGQDGTVYEDGHGDIVDITNTGYVIKTSGESWAYITFVIIKIILAIIGFIMNAVVVKKGDKGFAVKIGLVTNILTMLL